MVFIRKNFMLDSRPQLEKPLGAFENQVGKKTKNQQLGNSQIYSNKSVRTVRKEWRTREGLAFVHDSHSKATHENLRQVGKVGLAYGGGDCFFDSIAQGLEKARVFIPIKGEEEGYKKLRLLCRKFALKYPDFCKSKLEEDYNQYVHTIQWSAPEIEAEHEEKRTRQSTAVWGRQNVEGLFICKELGIKLHVIELYEAEGQLVCFHQLVDGTGSKTILENAVNYNDPKIIHIIGYKLHFVPYLPHFLKSIAILEKDNRNVHPQLLDNKNDPLGIQKAQTLAMPLKDYNKQLFAVAESYNKLGTLHRALGETKESVICYQKTLEILLKIYGEKHPLVATSYNNLGNAYRTLGEIEPGLRCYKNALDILLKIYGEAHFDVALCYYNLGSAYQALGKIEEAVMCQGNALLVESKKLTKNLISTVPSLFTSPFISSRASLEPAGSQQEISPARICSASPSSSFSFLNKPDLTDRDKHIKKREIKEIIKLAEELMLRPSKKKKTVFDSNSNTLFKPRVDSTSMRLPLAPLIITHYQGGRNTLLSSSNASDPVANIRPESRAASTPLRSSAEINGIRLR
jgi:tetratricopeptide (TPR) repeat protein